MIDFRNFKAYEAALRYIALTLFLTLKLTVVQNKRKKSEVEQCQVDAKSEAFQGNCCDLTGSCRCLRVFWQRFLLSWSSQFSLWRFLFKVRLHI
jgi:hypothetical protein